MNRITAYLRSLSFAVLALIFANVAPADACNTVGSSNYSEDEDGFENKIVASRFQAGVSFTASKMRVFLWGGGTGQKVRMGIYSDNSGSPGSLLGQTSEIVNTSGGTWNQTSLTSNVSISNGSYYWLALISNSATVSVGINFDAGTNKLKDPQTYGSLPSSFGTAGTYAHCIAIEANDSGSTSVAPTITTQPTNQTIAAGLTATFSVTATGTTPLSYQWKKNGTDIANATSASYTTPATDTTFNNASYTCYVSNSAGNATSNAATLTVQWAPVFLTHPASQTVTSLQTATFSVAISANPAATLAWKKNTNPITGATSTPYTTPATDSTYNTASYTCTATNSKGSTTSNAATLTVQWMPNILTQPTSQTVNAGQSASFIVVVSANPAPTYTWKKDGATVGSSQTFTISSVSSSDAGSYTCYVQNQVYGVTSAAAVLTVNTPPTFTLHPQSDTICDMHTTTFTVAASGTPTPTLQWKKNGVDINGATGTQYTSVWDDDENGSILTCVATNSVGSATSDPGTLTYNYQPAFEKGPTSKTVAVGDQVQFSFTLSAGTAPMTYQWNKNGTAIPNAIGAIFSIASAQTTDAGRYSCTVTNMCEDVTTEEATLNVGTGVAAFEYPENCGEGENMKVDGKIVVGNVTNPTAALEVGGVGDIKCAKLKINDWTLRPADYVFDKGHAMLDLAQLEAFIAANKHLPNVPSGAEMKKNGIDMTEMNMALLRTLEETTLRMIDLNRKIEAQQTEIEKLKACLKQ